MNNVEVLTSTTSGVLRSEPLQAEDVSSAPPKPQQKLDFFLENRYERILVLARDQGLADNLGVVTEPRGPYKYTRFNRVQHEFLEKLKERNFNGVYRPSPGGGEVDPVKIPLH